MGPGHDVVDAGLWRAADERVGEPGVRIDVVEFGRLDQRCYAGPVGAAFIGSG